MLLKGGNIRDRLRGCEGLRVTASAGKEVCWMSWIIFPLAFVLASSASGSSDVDWTHEVYEISDDVKEVYVGYYGLGVSFEFTDKLSDRIEVRYPSTAYGRAYETKVVEDGDVISIYVFQRGHEPVKSKDASRFVINALRMVADILERKESGECPYFVVKLPKRFEGHFRIEPIL